MAIYAAPLLFPGSDWISTDHHSEHPKRTPSQYPALSVFIPHWKLVLGTVPHSEVEISGGDMAHQWPNTLHLALN